MIRLLTRLPLYWLAKRSDYFRPAPFSLTVSVTRRCNSRCRTCNIWKDTWSEELTLEELRLMFSSLDRESSYITFSGGEPFLRKDFPEICISAIEISRPYVVTIPTNGILSSRIHEAVNKIIDHCGRTRIIVNLSLDGLGEKHDEIRGVPGCFDSVLKTFRLLKGIESSRLQVGFHTVISKYNVMDIREIYSFVKNSGADSYVTEIAEERFELGTVGSTIMPSGKDYSEAASFLSDVMDKMPLIGFARIIRVLRKKYYRYVTDMLTGGNAFMECYAGYASGHVNSNGDVWFCCMKAEPVGNIREYGFDFKKLWYGDKAVQKRKDTAGNICRCPMANVFYTNILLNPRKMFL